MAIKEIWAVAGNPIIQSRSAILFNSLFEDKGRHYTKIQSANIEDVLEIASAADIKGLNITYPLKQSAYNSAEIKDPVSIELKAANTLIFNNEISAFNTDIYGAQSLIKHIRNINKSLIIGTGASAETLLLSANDRFNIYGRNKQRLRELFDNYGVEAVSNPGISRYETIINCLPHGALPTFSLDNFKGLILDVNYNNPVIRNIAEISGSVYIDGKEWLLNQAIASFNLFTGEKVDYKAIENAFNNYSPKKNLAIIGFMGAGKTTFAKKLASEQKAVYVDLDEFIVQSHGLTISEIFKAEGERGFRRIESSCLLNLFKLIKKQKEKYIISMGGGIIETEENLPILKQLGEILWLYHPLKGCLERAELSSRPLLNSSSVEIGNLYNTRINKYAKASDLIIYNKF